MHLISELPDHLEALPKQKTVSGDRMITKREMSILESILFLHAIEQCEGKRKASEALNTSIDTINKYIDNLEHDLGVKLVSTNVRGSSLTAIAKRIVDKTDKIKDILEDIQSIRLENREIKGEVRVFVALGYASYMVPQDLSALFDTFPELSINSSTASDPSNVKIKDLDIIVTFEPVDDFDAVLISEKEVHCGFFASSQYLAKKGYPTSLEDLALNHRLISKHDDLLRKVMGEDLFKKITVCFKSNNTLALINALENHTGVGIMPLSFALQGLVCLDNIICNSPVHYYLFANKNTKDIPRVRTLINFYKDIMDKMENPVPVPALAGEPLPILRRFGDK